jgi:hypothetical protein
MVRWGRTRLDPVTGHFRKKVTVLNPGARPIPGPLAIVLEGLSRKIRLRRMTGLTQLFPPPGSPFMDLVPGGSVLGPGQSVTLDLEFVNPLERPLRFSTRVVVNPA